ncbi:MAG TPA: hypothetical protein VGL93_00530 [Streptosporangiaceae bacterium]|jgi:hypothetical protein
MTRADGDDEDAPVDLAAILRSEKLLSDLAERREPAEPARAEADGPEPLRLLAALAADVDDDDARTAAAGAPARRRLGGRKWVAAMVGLAAAIGTTGVAAAGANVFTPISGLFGSPARPTAVAGTEHAGGDHRTTGPSRRATNPRADPARTTGDPRPTNYAPAGDAGAPIDRPTSRLKSAEDPGSSRTMGAKPTTAPTGGRTPAATPTPTPTPTGTNRWWPPLPKPSKDKLRIGRGLGSVIGTPTTRPADDGS